MEKKYIKFLITIVLIVIIMLLITKIPIVEGYLFSGKHITINLSLSLNGEKISLDNLKATCIHEKYKNCPVISENGTFKTDEENMEITNLK
jgi:hypothetical protein